MILVKLLRMVLEHLKKLFSVLLLQLIDMHVGSLLIISHKFVPILGKFIELYLLGLLNRYQFTMLSHTHVVSLPVLFIFAPFSKVLLELVGHHVILITLMSFTYCVH